MYAPKERTPYCMENVQKYTHLLLFVSQVVVNEDGQYTAECTVLCRIPGGMASPVLKRNLRRLRSKARHYSFMSNATSTPLTLSFLVIWLQKKIAWKSGFQRFASQKKFVSLATLQAASYHKRKGYPYINRQVHIQL